VIGAINGTGHAHHFGTRARAPFIVIDLLLLDFVLFCDNR